MLSRSTIRTKTRVHVPALFVALAVSAIALWAGPAAAAAPTTLTAAVASAVVYPASATITGTISVPKAVLSLSMSPVGAGDWSQSPITVTAGPDGSFSCKVVKPKTSADYQFSYLGDAGHEPAMSPVVTLHVRPHITTSFPASLWLGGSVSLRGTVAPATPARSGGAIVIERRVAGVWQSLASATLNDSSRFSVRWTPDTFGFYRLRARMEADADHAAGASAPEPVVVNRPNAHRVPYRYAHYIVIVRHEYRLYYYEHGALVRAFDVALGRPGYRTPLGYFHIYGKRKPAGGALGACAMYYRHLGGIAIHGTDQPYLIHRRVPRDFSHGCARMLNRQVLWLYDRVPVGTRVHNLR